MWFNKYKNTGDGNPLNVAQNIIIDNEDINIPKNLPTFIVGSKNAGKSTLISTLIHAEHENNVYTRIFYIYTDHVDTTLAETCHDTLIRIPLNHSINFITEYFKIKSEYMSWIKFIEKNELADYENTKTNKKLEELTKIYTDNIIDTYIRNNININRPNSSKPVLNKSNAPEKQEITSPEAKIISYAISFIYKYSDPWEIIIDDVVYHLEGLRYNQYDQLIIDDVGVANAYLFPTTINKSPLYKFLTISRHILLGTIIAGQDLLQIPKYARKEMNSFLFGKGINIEDVDKTNIPKNIQKDIIREYPTLKQYDFIIYNGVENSINYITNN